MCSVQYTRCASMENISKLVLHGNAVCGDVATPLPLLARLRNLAIVHCQGASGTFTGPVVRFISDIRKKHGHDVVSLKGCGRFDLADDFSDIADIAHIDLSSIGSLQGVCGHLFPSSLMNINARSAGPPSCFLLASRSPVSCNSEKARFSGANPRPGLAQAPLPLPISLASRISATAPFFKNPLAGPLV